MGSIFHLSAPSETPPRSRTSPYPTIKYEMRSTPAKKGSASNSVIYVVTIPLRAKFSVTPAFSETTETVESFAKRENALAAINGGFFDPQNQQSTSYVSLRGQIVADPRQNDHLANNPMLAPYLKKIFNRTELRQYQCDRAIRYEFVLHNASIPPGCRLESSLGGGPRLLPILTAQQEGFVDATSGRDPLGSNQPNARSAIGLTRNNTMIWVMVAQPSASSSPAGLSLTELAQFMQSLGVESAMNLDGGSSSALYYQGKTVYGKVDESGNRVQRSVKSVLLVKTLEKTP